MSGSAPIYRFPLPDGSGVHYGVRPLSDDALQAARVDAMQALAARRPGTGHDGAHPMDQAELEQETRCHRLARAIVCPSTGRPLFPPIAAPQLRRMRPGLFAAMWGAHDMVQHAMSGKGTVPPEHLQRMIDEFLPQLYAGRSTSGGGHAA
ncbi:MAG: hypothetical protein ACODAG_07735 [Myxococcota bacterium]